MINQVGLLLGDTGDKKRTMSNFESDIMEIVGKVCIPKTKKQNKSF